MLQEQATTFSTTKSFPKSSFHLEIGSGILESFFPFSFLLRISQSGVPADCMQRVLSPTRSHAPPTGKALGGGLCPFSASTAGRGKVGSPRGTTAVRMSANPSRIFVEKSKAEESHPEQGLWGLGFRTPSCLTF